MPSESMGRCSGGVTTGPAPAAEVHVVWVLRTQQTRPPAPLHSPGRKDQSVNSSNSWVSPGKCLPGGSDSQLLRKLKKLFFKIHLFWLCWVWLDSMWDLVPWPGIKPGPLHWEHRVLATGPPGKSLENYSLELKSFPYTSVISIFLSLPWGKEKGGKANFFLFSVRWNVFLPQAKIQAGLLFLIIIILFIFSIRVTSLVIKFCSELRPRIFLDSAVLRHSVMSNLLQPHGL